MKLQAIHLSFAYQSNLVFDGVDVELVPGITAIIGPNAAGKSTLLKCLCGLLTPRGEVRIDGRALRSYTSAELSEVISYLPQGFAPHAVLTVFETVLLGRYQQLGWRVANKDIELVERLLDEMDLSDLATRYVNELSGGQAQMVAIAQALVREPAVLLLDEPTSHLDLRHQFEALELIREASRLRGICTAIAMHDLNMAARFADAVCVLYQGRVHSSGPPAKVFTAEMISTVYQVEAQTALDSHGRPVITILGSCPSSVSGSKS